MTPPKRGSSDKETPMIEQPQQPEPDLVQAFDLSRGYIRDRLIKPLERAAEVLEAAIAGQQSLNAATAQLAAIRQQTADAQAAQAAAVTAKDAAETQATAAKGEATRAVVEANRVIDAERRRLETALGEAQQQHRARMDALRAEQEAVQADAGNRLRATLADLATAQNQLEALRAHLGRTPS